MVIPHGFAGARATPGNGDIPRGERRATGLAEVRRDQGGEQLVHVKQGHGEGQVDVAGRLYRMRLARLRVDLRRPLAARHRVVLKRKRYRQPWLRLLARRPLASDLTCRSRFTVFQMLRTRTDLSWWFARTQRL